MCFSAEVSFGVGTVLLTTGVVSINKAKSLAQIPLAAIPFIFAVQQFSEGFVWLGLGNNSYPAWQLPAAYVFLFFAQVVWPIWIPFSMLLLEKEKLRRKMMRVFLGIGILLSLCLAYLLLTSTIQVEPGHSHIRYLLGFPNWIKPFGSIFYFVATVISPMMSSIKRMPLLGIAILIAYVISYFFFRNYVISVWCFFAAVISVLVYLIIKSEARSLKSEAKS